jgi:radical SAM protein with 4Fe4S-binding SPASM domain
VATVKFPAPYLNPKSFDISWLDPKTQTYYLSDRTNNGVDAINAATDTFEGVIGAGDFSGAGTSASSTQKATCGPFGVGGPNGSLVLNVGGETQLWAGDGVTASSPVSSVKVFDLSSPPRHMAHRRRPLAVGDGRGVVFVSYVGEVAPSGFLPSVVGNVREQPLTSIYATAPLLAALRDPTRLRGRCGRCAFRDTCGGSRAQAFARLGDALAEDPTCAFEPDAPTDASVSGGLHTAPGIAGTLADGLVGSQ